MGTRTAARIAAQGDFLTLVNFLSGRYQNLAQMTIAGLFAVRMTDSDTVSIPSGPARADDGTAAGRSDCRSLRYCPVDTLVHTSPTPFKCRSQGSAGIGLMYVGGVWVPFSIISGTGSVITFSDTISRLVSVPFLDVVSTVTS